MQKGKLTLSSYEYKLLFQMPMLSVICQSKTHLVVTHHYHLEVILLLVHFNSSPVTVSQVCTLTRRDPVLSHVFRYIMEGWPTLIHEDLLPFTSKITELTALNGCILWGNGIVIPKELLFYMNYRWTLRNVLKFWTNVFMVARNRQPHRTESEDVFSMSTHIEGIKSCILHSNT